jgi:LysM repeat protein
MNAQHEPTVDPPDQSDPGQSSAVPLDSSRGAEGQLRFFKALTVILLLALLAGAAYFVYHQRKVQPVAIVVAGQTVTMVENASMATAVIKQALNSAVGAAYSADGDPQFTRPIQLQRVSDGTPFDAASTASTKLSTAVPITVLADLIVIKGKAFVALPDKQTAQAALNDVRYHYASMPPDASVVGTPTFQEKVQIVRKRVSTALCMPSAEDAAHKLLTPPPAKLYTVQPHDTGWLIARKFHLTFSDFIRANAGRDLDRLVPGDTVNISQTYPPLTVIVNKVTSATQSIIAGASQEDAGERRVTQITTYINGASVGTPQSVSVYTIRRAKPWTSLQ